MNLFTKQIVQIFIALLIVAGLIIYASVESFAMSSWQDFMREGPLDLPFVLFVFVAVVTLSFICGLFYGWLQWSSLKKVERRLDLLIAGKEASESMSQLPPDYSAIENKCVLLERTIREQKQAARRLTSEKIENQEKLIQEMVSQERQRLARELHDSVSQQLFAASMMMSAVNESRSQENPVETKQLAMVEEMIQQSQLEMRALLLHLRPVALKGKSLKEGIDELMRELAQKVPLSIHWTAEEIAMDRGMEDHLFRIVQESISNTLRHAKASRLEVLTIWRDGFVILRISDDGIGFDVEKSKLGSYGLQNMYERAVEIGGAMKIISLPANGTKLEVKVPLTWGNREGSEK